MYRNQTSFHINVSLQLSFKIRGVMEVSGSWLEVVLRRREGAAARVVAVAERPALRAEEANFMSRVCLLEASLALRSGRRETRSFLVKKRTPFVSARGRLCEPGYKLFFNSEIRVYEEILPRIETLLRQSGDPDPVLWPRLIGSIPSQLICLSNLKEEGFRVGESRSLDEQHAVLALAALGKLHAASAVALSRGVLDPGDLPAYYPASGQPAIADLFAGYLDLACDVIASHWSAQWQPFVARLRETKEGLSDTLADLYHARTPLVKVLSHGDLWVNNIMFKYSQDKPCELRLVDFQTVHYSTPGWDLTYLLTTSLAPDLRETRLDELLGGYLSSFASTLAGLGGGPETPSLAALRTELARLRLFGLVVAVAVLPVTAARRGQARPETEDLFLADTVPTRRPLFLDPDYAQLLKRVLAHTFPDLL